MELVTTPSLESLPEPIVVSHYTTKGLLTSNYKLVVKDNFRKAASTSLFGIRQRIKSSQFNNMNTTGLILKLTVFVMILAVTF